MPTFGHLVNGSKAR